MRGHALFSYALVAIASTVIAAPLDRKVVGLEKREPYYPAGLAKVGTVNTGTEFYHRRENEVVEAEAYVEILGVLWNQN
jgi:hypothetical protein